jgi:hypothetical protein
MLAGLAAALVAGAPTLAADSERLIQEGVALRRQRDDAAALRKFQEAFQLDQSPRVFAQMGLAEQALGRWVAAFEHLAQALESKQDPWIAKNHVALAGALAVVTEHVGQIEIVGGSPGAEVRIDGVARGALPLKRPLTLNTGTVTIDLSLAGHVPVQRTTVVRARQINREFFDALAPVSNGHGPPPAGAIVATTGAAAGDEDQPAAAPTAGTLRRATKWAAVGLAAASLGLGGVGLVGHNRAADRFNSGCGVDQAGVVQPLPGSTSSVESCRDLQGDVDARFRLEVIGFVGAAVLAGAGVALWLTEPPREDANRAAVTCLPSMAAGGGAWIGCRFRL